MSGPSQDDAPTPGLAAYLGTLVVLALLALVLTPVLWAVLSAFKSRADIFAGDVWPRRWSLENFDELLAKTFYLRWMVNSLVVALASTALGLLFCSLGGYAFAKFDFPGKTVMFWVVIASVSIPAFTTVIPLFGWLAKLGLLDTYWGVVLPQVAFGLGMSILLFRNYFRNLPDELFQAAFVDGCGYLRFFWHISVPLSRPIVATVGIVSFVGSWNSYILPLIMLNSESKYPWPLGIMVYRGEFGTEWQLVLAFITLTILPTVIVFFLAQKHIIAGLTAGAVKS